MGLPTRSARFVLVDTQSETSVDRDVVPAAIEFVVREIVSKRLKGEALSLNLCLLSIDRPVRHFEALSKRGTLPTTNIIDCYKNWHREWVLPTKSTQEGSIQTVWHIASAPTSEEGGKDLAEAVESCFSKIHVSQSEGRIVVIDSLSSILSFSPSLDTVLHLLDSLASYNAQNGKSDLPITVIATIRGNQLKPLLLEGLQKLASTHVIIRQLSLKRNPPSASDVGGDRDLVQISMKKRKASGRIHFEEHFAEMDWRRCELHKIEGGHEGIHPQHGDSAQDKKEEDASLELAQHGLSFRVTLSSKEREVRAAAGLPYLHKDEGLADSALALHPENLRLRKNNINEIESDSNDSSEVGSDGEDLFSEDV